jgi:hypothetical protein
MNQCHLTLSESTTNSRACAPTRTLRRRSRDSGTENCGEPVFLSKGSIASERHSGCSTRHPHLGTPFHSCMCRKNAPAPFPKKTHTDTMPQQTG